MNPDELAEFLAAEMKVYVAAAEGRIVAKLEERLFTRIEESVSAFLAPLLPGFKGDKGDPSTEPGPKGDKGDTGTVDTAALAAMVAAEVAKAVGAIDREALRGPPGIDGKDVDTTHVMAMVNHAVAQIDRESLRGPKGKRGEKGDRGDAGRDGVATTEELHLRVTDAIAKMVPVAVKEEVAGAFAVLPILVYKGVYLEGQDYLPGNTATWAGSLWHCNTATREKPPGPNGEWTLIVKRGRDGREVARA